MSEDIFSQFFNLFNNDEQEVNWELAKQISNHINKDQEPLFQNFLMKIFNLMKFLE